MKRRTMFKAAAGAVAGLCVGLFGGKSRCRARVLEPPTKGQGMANCSRFSWEQGQNQYSQTDLNENTWITGGNVYIIVRLRDVVAKYPFTICNGLVKVVTKKKILSLVIHHKLNTEAEREEAYNHLHGLRRRLELTKAEAHSYDVMLDCVKGKAGIVPLDWQGPVNS